VEDWKLRQTYRLAGRRLRGLALREILTDELVRLEADAACALAAADRVATELSVRRRALQATEARVRRLIKGLRTTRLLAGELPALARGAPGPAALALEERLGARGHAPLAAVVAQARGELDHQAERVREGARRLLALREAAALALRRLTAALDALPQR
jgi:hypothetical protein